jgi:hypothetical protein
MDLYAWATPAFVTGSPVDHTWVTTFDNTAHFYPSEQAVTAAGEHYWFCWGKYHPSGHTALGSQGGNFALACCLVQPNVDCIASSAARGTIFTYGVDGVCHQLANQVLHATGANPLTVKGANGYPASVFLYGMYGHQHTAWVNKIAGCSTAPVGAGGGGAGTFSFQSGGPSVDDFEERARVVLANEPVLLQNLFILKSNVHTFTAQRFPGLAPPSADTLNVRNQHLIDQAALLLGDKYFEEIFGFPPGKINLVDPAFVSKP